LQPWKSSVRGLYRLLKRLYQAYGAPFARTQCITFSCLLVFIFELCILRFGQGHAVLCYEKHAAMHAGLNSLLAASAGNWLVPPLKVVCRNTYQLAVQADAHKSNPLASSATSSVHLENAVTVIQESFSRTFNDRKELGNDMYSFSADGGGSKKSAVLYIVNLLFAAYFRLNTLRLCKNLVRPMESRNIPEQTQSYPLGQIIMYRYYVGRLYLFEDSYDQAEMQLQYCLSKCAVLDQQLRQRGGDTSGPSRILENNTRRILRYLIPVKIFRGKLPTLHSKWSRGAQGVL
jgi:hypothetical protein